MKFQIPKSFKMFGKTVKVKFDPALYYKSDASGLAVYKTGEIILQSASKEIPITIEAQEQIFFHEFAHFLLYEAGEDCFEPQLHAREFLVDRIGCLLHQAFTSAECTHKKTAIYGNSKKIKPEMLAKLTTGE